MKELNYRIGVLKRKFKMGKGDFAPGDLINKAKAQKVETSEEVLKQPSKKKTAILGLI